MSRRWFAFAALPALVAAGLLLFADQAQAQRWGRGLGIGVGNPYYGGYGWGSNYSGWGNTYSPWYGSRYYSGAYNTYYPSTWDYSWSYPSTTIYSGNMYDNSYPRMASADYDNMNMQGGYTSFYLNDQGQRERVPETAALINMRLHPNAKVWFFNDETKSQGAFRQYVTPALDGGKDFFYEIRARWNEGGRDVDRTRRVLVRAGDCINVDFMRDMTNVDEMTPEHLRQRENVRPAEGTRSERRNYEEDRNRELVNPPTDHTRPRTDRNDRNVPPPPPNPSEKPPQ